MQRSLLAWLQLLRFPNHPTALADILAGFAFAQGSLHPPPLLVTLLATSWLLYAAGMVLNDVHDVDQDRRERPDRPIPSGRISIRAARRVGWAMLLVGVICGFAASSLHEDPTWMRWRSAGVAAVLAVLIVLYDGPLKATLIGPLLMGACRSANLLLGMSAGAPAQVAGWVGFQPAELVVALGMGVYVAGITVFARDEAGEPRRAQLLGGVTVIVGGLSLLTCVNRFEPFVDGGRAMPFSNPMVWPGLLALIGFSIVRRGIIAAISRESVGVQAAVKHMVLSIIVLDAAIALAGGAWSAAVLVLSLLIPSLLLGKFVYAT